VVGRSGPGQEGPAFRRDEFRITRRSTAGRRSCELGGGVPTISFRDIEVQERESDLVGASFGRSFFVLDDYGPLREAGDAYYVAPNPPFGAVFTYYLKDGVKPAAEARREEEAKLAKDGKPVPFPGWDRLRQEEDEEKPAVVLIVKDEAGQVVRRIAAPAAKGLHRVAWNLRYPAVEPTRLEALPRESWEREAVGPMVVPGRFTVTMAKVADGITTALAGPQEFVVESLNTASLPEKDKAALLAFQEKAGELQRALMGAGAAAEDALGNIRLIKKALLDTPKSDPKLAEAARAIEKRIQDELVVLFGDRTRGTRSEPTEPALMGRVSAQLDATAPITATARRGSDRGRRIREAPGRDAASDRDRSQEAPGRPRGRRRAVDARPRRPHLEEIKRGK
jgi:hypothetical protein